MVEIDINKLREDLMNYFGPAAFGPFPFAMADLLEVQNATPEKLIKIAKRNNFDLNKYVVKKSN